MTNINTQCNILGNFYLNYKADKGLSEFMEFNDIGLPLAYLSSEGLCDLNETSNIYIQETFDMLLITLGLEDIGFESLEHLLSTAEQKSK
jgi:hypothetical protein